MTRRGRLFLLLLVFFECAVSSRLAHAETHGGVAVGPVPAWVDPVQSENPHSASNERVSNGRHMLLYDRQVRVSRQGTEPSQTYEHWSQEIVNESGLQAASQVKIEFDPTYESLVMHSLTVRRGGESFDRLDLTSTHIIQREPRLEAQIYDGRQTAVFFLSDLRIGDVVDYAYSLRGRDPTLEGKFADNVFLGGTEPYDRLRLRVQVPQERHVAISLAGPTERSGPQRLDELRDATGTTYIWDASDTAAFAIEPDVPGWYVPVPFVAFSEFGSWRDVADWGARLFRSGRSDAALHDWVRARLLESASLDDFVLHAIRFVQDEVRYVGMEVGMARRRPSDPNEVFARRYGDCKEKAALLIAILNDAKITAHPALVSSTRGRSLDDWVPSPQAFDHAIVKITKSDGTVYWVDPTAILQGGTFDTLRTARWERALELDPSTSSLDEIPPKLASSTTVHIVEHYHPTMPGSNGLSWLDTERIYTGDIADVMRSLLHAQSREDSEKLFRARYEQDFPGIRTARALEYHDDRDRNVIRVVTHFAVPEFWAWKENLRLYAATVSARSLEGFIHRPEAQRKAPLALGIPLRVLQEINIALPYDLPTTPSTDSIESPEFRFRFASAYFEHLLTYRYEWETKNGYVPSAGLEAHAAHVDKVRAALARSLTYRPLQPDTTNWLALVPLGLTVPLLGWGAVRAYRYEPRGASAHSSHVSAPGSARPIGGWLIFLGFVLFVTPLAFFSPALSCFKALVSTELWRALTTEGTSTYRPAFAAAIVVAFVSYIGITFYLFTLIVLFLRKKRAFPFHFRIGLLAILCSSIFDFVVDRTLSPVTTGNNRAALFRTIVYCLIWIPYTYRSKRVARTFVL